MDKKRKLRKELETWPSDVREPARDRTDRRSVAYNRLRDDIMRGVLAPGQKAQVQRRSAKRMASAWARCAKPFTSSPPTDLSRRRNAAGSRSSRITPEQLIDAASVRILLEEEGLRRSIKFGDVEWEVAVLGTYRRLESWSEALARRPHNIDDQWQAYHRDFHRALVSACRSPTLLDFRDTMFARWERYARLFLSTELHDVAVTTQQHQRASRHKDAALARDADRAAVLLRKHFEGTRDLLLDWLARRNPNKSPGKRRLQKQTRKAD